MGQPDLEMARPHPEYKPMGLYLNYKPIGLNFKDKPMG